MSTVTRALSVALVDFFWQGAFVGLLLWAALGLLRNRSANARYIVSCAALVALAVLPIATTLGLWVHAAGLSDVHGALSDLSGLSAGPRVLADMPQTLLPIWLVSDQPRIAWLARVEMWTLPIWSVGVLLFSLRLAFGCTHSFALQRRAASADEPVLSTVAALAGRIGIDRPVRVLVSSLTEGPSVAGWLRPAILLPPAAAMGLTPEQLEAVLAHELAHIKRHDYLVNMLQIVTETLFFYHPVVWWASKQIRIDRELCCDDIAVKSCGDPVCYAYALTTLARQRLTSPALAMSATGGSLMHRIQRLLGAPEREYGPSRLPVIVVLGIALTFVLLRPDWLTGAAEPQASDLPRFEVASIKPNTRNDGQIMVNNQGDTYTAIGISLGRLIQSAYQVQEFQIAGGPKWIDSDVFDVIAKGEPSASSPATSGGPTRRQLMLRTLLTERFGLAVHKETRDLPVYALVMANSDRRPGPQLHPSRLDCPAACGTGVMPGLIRASGQTMAQVATAFSLLTNTGSSLNRLVVDRTGLPGLFDFELHFTPDHIPAFGPGGPPPGLPPIDANGPSIFTAVQEQLGIKLDSQRGPVEVLVIDRVEHPTEN